MKKFFKALLVIFVIACVAFDGLLIWHRLTPVKSFDIPGIELNGVQAGPVSGFWHTKTILGFYSKDTEIEGKPPADAGEALSDKVLLKVPSDAKSRVTVRSGEEVIFDSTAEQYESYTYPKSGNYEMDVELFFEETENFDELHLSYKYEYAVDTGPLVYFSSEEALQGQIVTVTAEMGLSEEVPKLETALGVAKFVPVGIHTYTAFVPVGFAQIPGDYEITVTAKNFKKTEKFKVLEAEYEIQNLTMPKSVTQRTRNAPNAAEDFREKIGSTYKVFDNIKYWDSVFIQPVEGRVTTEFGVFRYVNKSKKPTRHVGIDIAAENGTPVPASNAGRVVFAGDVINTGKSVVIEHGGGLKSYYYHLSELSCKTGDIVEQKDIIGKVGSTGYSTGPHLHFEVRIGEYPINPWPLFDGSSSIYKNYK